MGMAERQRESLVVPLDLYICPSGECDRRLGSLFIHTREDWEECQTLYHNMQAGYDEPGYTDPDPERTAYFFDVPSHWRY